MFEGQPREVSFCWFPLAYQGVKGLVWEEFELPQGARNDLWLFTSVYNLGSARFGKFRASRPRFDFAGLQHLGRLIVPITPSFGAKASDSFRFAVRRGTTRKQILQDP